MDIVERQKLMEMQFRTVSGEVYNADKYIVFQYLYQDYSLFMGVCMLCAVIAVMLGLFIGFHLYLIGLGYTTNEWTKRSQV